MDVMEWTLPQILLTPVTMGVCKLEYKSKNNKLVVHLRRPGLLIGKGGCIINALIKYLDCEISIVEVNLNK